MSEESKRIFVGGISASITEGELISKFKKFGSVRSVELKTKKDVLGGPPNTFAFINISLTPDALYECFTTLGNSKWKGSFLRLEVAKENFLDRLKKEREHQQASSNSREFRKRSFSDESHQIVRQEGTSGSFVPTSVDESRTRFQQTTENLGPAVEDDPSVSLPLFKGFIFSGKGDFDFLFETSQENTDGYIAPHNKRKMAKEVNASEHSEKKPRDDLMSRMESFSNMWKGDSIAELPETKYIARTNILDVAEENQPSLFQTSVSSYIRFDPTRKAHQKYILSPSKKKNQKSRKGTSEDNDDAMPKENFYKVVDDLKSRFESKKSDTSEGNSFSLLAALGNQNQTQDSDIYNDSIVQQFEEGWSQQDTWYESYKTPQIKNSFLAVAGDPRLEEGAVFISEKPDKQEMLRKWKEQKPMLKILWKKKHKDALREDKGVKVLRGTSLAFPGRGRGQKAFRRRR